MSMASAVACAAKRAARKAATAPVAVTSTPTSAEGAPNGKAPAAPAASSSGKELDNVFDDPDHVDEPSVPGGKVEHEVSEKEQRRTSNPGPKENSDHEWREESNDKKTQARNRDRNLTRERRGNLIQPNTYGTDYGTCFVNGSRATSCIIL